jgi:hypothetical protein
MPEASFAPRMAAELLAYLQLVNGYRSTRPFCLTCITELEVPPSDILARDMLAGQDFPERGEIPINPYTAMRVLRRSW